jgi:FMN-dependent oxidoreductase (nitrilotriacetate monooxygenase family)
VERITAENSDRNLSSGLWKHPKNRHREYASLKYWTDLAKILERGKFHALFLADVLGGYDVYKGPANLTPTIPSAAQFPVNDPLYSVPAMAAVTESLAFGVTASTTYESPYALARRFSTVDHLTDGRVAWNIVTSYLDSAARNFGLDTQVEHDERYRIAEEYMDVVYKLWESSWRDDAVIKDAEHDVYAIPKRVRQINHKGKHFNVPGPHMCEPSPQRTPFIFQAGTSKAGKLFGAKHAEAIFVHAQVPEKLAPSVRDIRQTAKEQFGRDPYSIKIIAGVLVIVAPTDEEARAKHAEYRSYGNREGALALFGGWSGYDLSTYSDDEDFRFTKETAVRSIVTHWADTVPGSNNEPWTKDRIANHLLLGGNGSTIVGSPKTVVDELERWVEVADVDGFNLQFAVSPGTFEDIIEYVIPELQARGLFHTDYEKPGATARESILGQGDRLLPDHYGSQFRWRAEGGEQPSSQT